MFECVVMALARLTDPERTGKFGNLSIAYLLSMVNPIAKDGLRPFVDAAQAKAEFEHRVHIRLISARRPTKNERRQYEEALGQG
jgi:hypothetical protein